MIFFHEFLKMELEMDNCNSKYRLFGYDVLINYFENKFRQYLIKLIETEVGFCWIDHISSGIEKPCLTNDDISDYEEISVERFVEGLNFSNLKEISIYDNNFSFMQSFIGDISKDKFIELMNELSRFRNHIAHLRSSFSQDDLEQLIEYVRNICSGPDSQLIIYYLNIEGYLQAEKFPDAFCEEFTCLNNLPYESYNQDGGFVGREKEIQELQGLILSEQDRIVTITGPGGLGKKSIALKLAYNLLNSIDNPYESIIWFSAEKPKINDDGYFPIIPCIDLAKSLGKEIFKVLDPDAFLSFGENEVTFESYKEQIYRLLKNHKSLLIIDNLETIIHDNNIVDIIRDIPRPSQVLITSQRGLGEIERRFPLPIMSEKEAIRLFRMVSKARSRQDLENLTDNEIGIIVKKIRNYPLLIKWCIGQVCLGKLIDSAFSPIISDESELAKIIFDDIFSMLSELSKKILFSIIILGEESVSKPRLMQLVKINDKEFEDAIHEIIITSFIYPVTRKIDAQKVNEYALLHLAGIFVASKLDEYSILKESLIIRYRELSLDMQECEKNNSTDDFSHFSLVIKTDEELKAFQLIKEAKNYIANNNIKKGEEFFYAALEIAPYFSYVLIENAKFKLSQYNSLAAQELAIIAVEKNPTDYYCWFWHGVILRKNNRLDDAETCLLKARNLNPKFFHIYTEIARVHSYQGEYEAAEEEYAFALQKGKIFDNHYRVRILQSMAENYRQWSKTYDIIKDNKGRQDKINKSLETIKVALNLSPFDNRLWQIQRKCMVELGDALCAEGNYAQGKLYLEKCIQPIHFFSTIIQPDDIIVAWACFYLLYYSEFTDERPNSVDIENWWNKGISSLKKDSPLEDKYTNLQESLKKISNISGLFERIEGKIDFFNIERKFGIINTETEKFIFFLTCFNEYISESLQLNLKDSVVTFIPRESDKNGTLRVANKIEFSQ